MGWPQIFDQYANRLAHLYLLCVENDVDAYLVMLYFYNDAEMDGPISVDQWRGAIEVTETLLGVRNHRLKRYGADAFVDVNALGGCDGHRLHPDLVPRSVGVRMPDGPRLTAP